MYQKFLQSKGDLGQKMESAFIAGFAAGYKSICIIGTDCLDLRGRIITEAFEKLLSHDITVGPAADGGYYLLGMNRLYADLFKNKQWGTGTVLTDTLDDVKSLGLSCWQLEVLNDIDRVADLPPNFGLDQ
jgi:rSAM/selenodomain-associated transferase 1